LEPLGGCNTVFTSAFAGGKKVKKTEALAGFSKRINLNTWMFIPLESFPFLLPTFNKSFPKF